MQKLNKVIAQAIRVINLPYNQFNLNNYIRVLVENGMIIEKIENGPDQPINLMADGNMKAGIISLGTRGKKNIYIVGKGILFDSGGLDIKPSGRMTDMTDDKAGAIIALAVANYVKKNVIAYCPVTTNFIQTSRITPGDIIPIGNKNVKVTNTDAEGRLILAEALSTLDVKKDDIVITIATLTGCCAYAVDTKATAYLTPNDKLAEQYAKASQEADEYAWRLPLWNYIDEIFQKKDINNSEREIKGDTIGAGCFLKQFVKYPENWIHLDIASSAFTKGKANGVPIKSLINFISKL